MVCDVWRQRSRRPKTVQVTQCVSQLCCCNPVPLSVQHRVTVTGNGLEATETFKSRVRVCVARWPECLPHPRVFPFSGKCLSLTRRLSSRNLHRLVSTFDDHRLKIVVTEHEEIKRVSTRNGVSTGSAGISVWPTHRQTDRHTDRPRYVYWQFIIIKRASLYYRMSQCNCTNSNIKHQLI